MLGYHSGHSGAIQGLAEEEDDDGVVGEVQDNKRMRLEKRGDLFGVHVCRI